MAAGIWADINGVNLRENIAPTRKRAHLILENGENHEVLGVRPLIVIPASAAPSGPSCRRGGP